MRQLFSIGLIAAACVILTGCSGCSDSSLRYRLMEQDQIERPQQPAPQSQPNPIPPPRPRAESTNSRISETSRTLTLEDLFELRKDAVFLVFTRDDQFTYQGSGFFVDDRGLAVSNYHVFEGTRVGNELIQTIDGNNYRIATVIERNKDLDYIIFRVRGVRNNPYIPLSNTRGRVGENVFAIGNPRGLTHTLSTGIISGFRDDFERIQTTAEITHGSSGGALMNMRGEVIGITTSGFGEANINFAINIEKLRLERFIN